MKRFTILAFVFAVLSAAQVFAADNPVPADTTDEDTMRGELQLGAGIPLSSVYGTTTPGVGLSATFLLGAWSNVSITASIGYFLFDTISDIPVILGARYALPRIGDLRPYVGGGFRMRASASGGTSASFSANGLSALGGVRKQIGEWLDVDANLQIQYAGGGGGTVIGLNGGVMLRLE